jgi:hypothetical protein
MKYFRTTKEFARAVCAEKGQVRPEKTWYLVEHEDHGVKIENNAPRSYRNLKRVLFCVDGERFAERTFGIWVESPDSNDKRWLMERQLLYAVDVLAHADLTVPFLEPSRNVDVEIQYKLNDYLNAARSNLYEGFNVEVIAEATRLMKKDRCFAMLECCGDPLSCDAA